MTSIITNIYVMGCVLLPLFMFFQHLNGRAYPFIALTILHILYTVITGTYPPIDTLAILVMLFGGVIVVGMFRSNLPPNVAFSTIQWLCVLWLLLVSRAVMPIVIMIEIYIIGIFYSFFQMKEIVTSDNEETKVFFGNSNHNGAYYMISLLVGIYLMININYLFLIPNALLLLVIVLGHSRSAILSALFTLPIQFGLIPSLIVWGILGLGIARIVWNGKLGTRSNAHDTLIYRGIFAWMAIKLIKQSPIFGHGLESFRRNNNLMYNSFPDGWAKDFISHRPQNTNIGSHRIHNDHLELMVELGIPGYIAFLLIFMFIPFDPFYLSLVVGVGICGLMFFPLREIHTSLPFYVLVGIFAYQSLTFNPSPIITLFIIYYLSFIGWEVYLKGRALFAHGKMMVSQNLTDISTSAAMALEYAPTDSKYLMHAAAIAAPYSIEEAYDYSSRALYLYDGESKLWELYHQLATIILTTNVLDLAKITLNKALNCYAQFQPSITLLERVEALIRQRDQVQGGPNEPSV